VPELPEVEVTRQALLPLVKGRRLERIIHEDEARYRDTDRAAGQRIHDLRRRGKFLIFDLDEGHLVAHLGMSGGFRFAPTPHTRAVLELEREKLYFHDPRRFGYLRWVVRPEAVPLLAAMGPEPLSEAFTPAYLRRALAGRRRPIKSALLDQRLVAGLGNIYSDEALFEARIHPLTPAGALGSRRIARLYEAIREVLSRAIAAGGSTLADKSYLRPDARPGYFQIEHAVYGREGQPCPVCGTPVARVRVGGRSAHFCPRCQRAGGRLASK